MTYSVELRALEPEDLELVYRIENDTRLWQWGGDSQPYSHYTIRQYLEQQKADIYADRQLRMVVCADGRGVGFADLTDFSPHHLRAEVGIVVEREYQHLGLATQALQLLAEYAQRHFHLRSLHAYVCDCNQPAMALFRRLGYTEVGHVQRWMEGKEAATLFQTLL